MAEARNCERNQQGKCTKQKFTLTVCEVCKYNYSLRNDIVFMSILLIEVFDKVLRYDYIKYMSLSIL
jgi:hypothetical protein